MRGGGLVGDLDQQPVTSPGLDGGSQAPENATEALGMVLAGLEWLAGADVPRFPASIQTDCLRKLENARSVQAAAHAAVLSAFDRAEGYTEDGQGTARTWLRWQTQVTGADASASVAWMRTLREHPAIAEALVRMRVTVSMARLLCKWSDKLPAPARGDADKVLLDGLAAGLELADLAKLVEQMLAALAEPDEDPADKFSDRRLRLRTTYGGAGYLDGDLTPQCAEAVQAVLDALSKKMGQTDDRTIAQRRHDALLEACRRLIASGCLPDRAGQPTQIQLHIGLDELLRRSSGESGPGRGDAAPGSGDGGTGSRDTGTGGRNAGEEGEPADVGPSPRGLSDLISVPEPAHPVSPAPPWPLAEPGDECDDTIVPIVKGFLDHELVDRLVSAATGSLNGAAQNGVILNADSVRDLFIENAAALFAGPRGLASGLSGRDLDGIAGSVSLPLDVGAATETIPPHLRRAVILRDRHCAAPGCDQPPAGCQVHHVRPRSHGGGTKLTNLLLLCSFHHLILVHKWGWTITLNADGTTTMTSPDGSRIYHSHSPPAAA